MIKVEDIKKIVKLALLTGDIKDVKPVSVLIVGKSGNGKTEVLASYDKKKALYITDLSAHGLLDELKKYPEISHIIIPDFIKLTQKQRSTSNNLISMLNALIEEGGAKVSLKNYHADFEGKRIGMITATTKASFSQNKKDWMSIGFVQRMLVVSYDYKDETIAEILSYINKELFETQEKEKLKDYKIKKIITDEEMNRQFNFYVKKNFRTLKSLQALAKSHAFMNKRKEVVQEDVDEVIRLTKYMNLNFTKL